MANGGKIDPTYLSSWWHSFEYQLGKRRSHLDFGLEMPTEDDFELWFRAFNTSTLGTMCLQNRLGNWVAASPRIWRVFYDEEENCMEVLSDTEGLLKYRYGSTRTFYRF